MPFPTNTSVCFDSCSTAMSQFEDGPIKTQTQTKMICLMPHINLWPYFYHSSLNLCFFFSPERCVEECPAVQGQRPARCSGVPPVALGQSSRGPQQHRPAQQQTPQEGNQLYLGMRTSVTSVASWGLYLRPLNDIRYSLKPCLVASLPTVLVLKLRDCGLVPFCTEQTALYLLQLYRLGCIPFTAFPLLYLP